MPTCPRCGSSDLRSEQYDFGTSYGYHDAGERIRCKVCGAALEADELLELEETIQ